MIKNLLLILSVTWCLPQQIIGVLVKFFGKYKLGNTPNYVDRSSSNKMRSQITSIYFWKNIHGSKKKTNMWVFGNIILSTIDEKRNVIKYQIPTSELQFASGYIKLSYIFGPLYLLLIVLPIWFKVIRYDSYCKKNFNKPKKINSYWSDFWITKLVTKMITF